MQHHNAPYHVQTHIHTHAHVRTQANGSDDIWQKVIVSHETLKAHKRGTV